MPAAGRARWGDRGPPDRRDRSRVRPHRLHELPGARFHPLEDGLRVHPDPHDAGEQRHEHGDLAQRKVGELFVHALVERIENHPLQRREQVHRGDDHAGRGDGGRQGVRPKRPEQHQELPDEAVRGRKPDGRQRDDRQHRREHRHGLGDPAERLDQTRMPPLVQHTGQEEQRAGRDAVVDHHQEGALDALKRERLDAEHHEAEVRNRRVRDQLLEVGLDHRDQAAVQDADQRERHDDPLYRRMHRDRREERQREPQEAVGAHLEKHPREQHRPRRGGLHMGIGEPGVEREHRHLDREREEERAEQPECDGPESADVRRQVRVRKRVHTGALAHEVHECEDCHQHEQRAEEGVQEELDGRVDAALPAPHSDDEVHRNEHHLPHHVEQEKIEGHEHPDHPRRQDEQERVKPALLLVLTTGMIGVFVALDLYLFYVVWEVMLIPMYFIIGVWGGERRIYAAIKFFLYTFFGSLLMLVAILALVYLVGQRTGVYSFSYAHLTAHIGGLGSLAFWLFGAFFLAFAIKVPMFPFHTWLPDAHVEAPTAGSVLLAGVLLKMGTYGFLRFALPLFPTVALHPAVQRAIVALSLIGILYGGLVAMVQPDFKKLIAYSSVAHLGFVMLGIWALTLQSVQGALLVMINHGISTGALFFLAGMLYERRHSRLIEAFGGIAKVVPMLACIVWIGVSPQPILQRMEPSARQLIQSVRFNAASCTAVR